MTKKRKQRITRHLTESLIINNPVARHAHKSNRCVIFRDKTKYNRKANKKSFEPFLIALLNNAIRNGLQGFYSVVTQRP
jgi:hypothetical protein